MDNQKIKYEYHHIGIPINKQKKNERYSSTFKMYTSDAHNSLFHVQYHRFEKESSLPKLLKMMPHLAFKVNSIDTAIENKNVLVKPYFPFEGFRVAIIEDGGIPIELIETNLTNKEIWDSTNNKKSIIYPDNKD